MIYYPTEAEARAAGPDPSCPKQDRLAVCRYDGGAFWYWTEVTAVRSRAYAEIAKRIGMECGVVDKRPRGGGYSLLQNLSRKSPKAVRLAAARTLLASIEATPDEPEAVK